MPKPALREYAASYWRDRRQRSEGEHPEFAIAVRRIARFGGAGCVLDVGAAPGTHLSMFRAWYPAANVVGLDAAEQEIRGQHRVVVADARRPPFHGAFKLVYAVNLPVFWRGSDVYEPRCMASLARLLRPPATLVVVQPAFVGRILTYLTAAEVEHEMRALGAGAIRQHFFIRPFPKRNLAPLARLHWLIESPLFRVYQDRRFLVYAATAGDWA